MTCFGPVSVSGRSCRPSLRRPVVLLAVKVFLTIPHQLSQPIAESALPIFLAQSSLLFSQAHSRLPKLSSLPPFVRQFQLFPNTSQFASVVLMELGQQPRVFFLQFDKLLFKLLVPGIENEDLKTEGGRANEKVGQREGFRYHCLKCKNFLGQHARMAGSTRSSWTF